MNLNKSKSPSRKVGENSIKNNNQGGFASFHQNINQIHLGHSYLVGTVGNPLF